MFASVPLTPTFAPSGWAAVQTTAPFVGQYRDNFDQYTATNAVSSLPVFGNHGTISVLPGTGSIKVEWSSQLGGDLVTPISGMMIGQLGIADWEFNQPMSKFGGMWENNSHADDATVTFFDASNNLLGTFIAPIPVNGQQWVWNGWESDVPFTRIHVVGNGLINGFIWYENMEATPAVPEPVTIMIGLFSLAGIARRRRSR